jgi:hypothetical protein
MLEGRLPLIAGAAVARIKNDEEHACDLKQRCHPSTFSHRMHILHTRKHSVQVAYDFFLT